MQAPGFVEDSAPTLFGKLVGSYLDALAKEAPTTAKVVSVTGGVDLKSLLGRAVFLKAQFLTMWKTSGSAWSGTPDEVTLKAFFPSLPAFFTGNPTSATEISPP
ncbi:hypothetical protein [Pseudomonas aeruginosa]|uniref:hypothetical protein n=1 Tax=Pseudomonas aeruginosa TaxID=287 RepID=UPI003D7F2BD6